MAELSISDAFARSQVLGVGAWFAERDRWTLLRSDLSDIFREIAEATPTSKEGK